MLTCKRQAYVIITNLFVKDESHDNNDSYDLHITRLSISATPTTHPHPRSYHHPTIHRPTTKKHALARDTHT